MDDEDDDPSVMGQIIREVKLEGFKPETPGFERRKRYLQVIRCREMRGFHSCEPCPARDHCSLFVAVKRDSLE